MLKFLRTCVSLQTPGGSRPAVLIVSRATLYFKKQVPVTWQLGVQNGAKVEVEGYPAVTSRIVDRSKLKHQTQATPTLEKGKDGGQLPASMSRLGGSMGGGIKLGSLTSKG